MTQVSIGNELPSFVPNVDSTLRSQLTSFMRYCEAATGKKFEQYRHFEQFAIEQYRTFWRLFLSWSDISWEGSDIPICVGERCEDARFFPDLSLNYSEVLLGNQPHEPAITACHRNGQGRRLTRAQLREEVRRLATSLRGLGVVPGDRVVAVARNNIEVIVAALAAAAIGSIFSSCSHDMGAFAILTRFAPLAPVVLFGNFRPEPWDQGLPVALRMAEVVAGLPSLAAVVALDDGDLPQGLKPRTYRFCNLVQDESPDPWRTYRFNHPLFILFSSGTTGAPKCIIHGAGGTLLEHLKEHRLHCDLKSGDKLYFQTSCGWMMWNWQLSALASGVELVVYDGPLEGPETQWQLIAEVGVTVFGTNPAYLRFCELANFSPGSSCDLTALRSVLSTGSILYPNQYDWVNDKVKNLPLQSICGGTDIVGCFVLGNPLLPVHRGQAQCRSLALDVRVQPPPEDTASLIGELICANPFPSRPLGFYGDPEGRRFNESYFSQNPGVWTHGDLIEFRREGGAILHGRSDGVINVRGIRIGPAEIYRILQGVDEITEAMAVEQEAKDEPGGGRLVLLVVTREGVELDAALTTRIRSELLKHGSTAMVPALIAAVAELPVTNSGKRSETAARDAVNGHVARNRDALHNPSCIDEIANHPALRPAADEAAVSCDTQIGDDLERSLQAICERVLRISPIEPSSNILECGADSLTMLELYIAVTEHTNCDLQFADLLSHPRIAELASFIRECASAGAAPRAKRRLGPQIRPAEPADIESISEFLHNGFITHGVPPTAWRRLFDYAWLEEKPNFGHILSDGGTIVGYLGAIYAQRSINDKEALFCNHTSWYVMPEYRGWAPELLSVATCDEDTTFTAFTPSPIVQQMMLAMGYAVLDTRKLALPPLFQFDSWRQGRPTVSFDLDMVRRPLDAAHQQLFNDHAGYDCVQLLIEDGSDHAFIIAKRRTKINVWLTRLCRTNVKVAYSEILYCSNSSLLQRHLERVKQAIMRRQSTNFLVCAEHLFPERPKGLMFDTRTLYRSRTFNASDLDKLYSELVLLPI